MNYSTPILDQTFYDRPTVAVAQELLGKILVHETPAGLTSGRIVEVEAYLYPHDKSAHSYRGKTQRNAPMFGPGGHAYVYFTYGMHFCMNVVAAAKGEGILIRALEPLKGLELMAERRKVFSEPGTSLGTKKLGRGVPEFQPGSHIGAAGELSLRQLKMLCSGPAKLTHAMGIGRAQTGQSLLAPPLYLLNAPQVPPEQIACGPRIGIRESVELPLRFWVRESKWVSR